VRSDYTDGGINVEFFVDLHLRHIPGKVKMVKHNLKV